MLMTPAHDTETALRSSRGREQVPLISWGFLIALMPIMVIYWMILAVIVAVQIPIRSAQGRR